MMGNPKDNTVTRLGLAPADYNSAQSGPIIDTQGFEYVEAVVTFGAINAAAAAVVHWLDGDESDMSDGAVVAGSTYAVDETADDNTVVAMSLRLQARKRYVRIQLGASASIVVGVGVKLYKQDRTQDLKDADADRTDVN